MRQSRVIFVTGKGGVGKTTVTAALGVHLTESRERTLIVETDVSGRLAAMFGAPPLSAEPLELQQRLFAVRLQQRALLEEYFESLLRVPFLSRRLLSSRTFNAVTAAAPGVGEFLLLQKLLQWLEPGWRGRRRFDTVLIDGPASGHALKLLAAPRTIASLVPAGPIGTVARRALALLADHHRTRVVVVAIPEELAITEMLETCDALANDIAVKVARPVVNRVFPRRFAPHEVAELETGEAASDPLVHAARFQLGRRREAERHLARLRRALGQSPVALPMVFAERLTPLHLHQLGQTLGGVL